MKLLKTTIISTILASALLAGVAETNKEAEALLKENKGQEALTLLEAGYKAGEFDNQTLFLLGMSAKKSGDLYAAEEYLKELLTKDGGAHRVRLELASVQYAMGKGMSAEENLKIVKASNPPKKVGDNIDEFLQAIAEGKPSNWNVGYTLGYMYDTNINAGPDGENINGWSTDAGDEDWALLFGTRGSYTAMYKDEYAVNTSAALNMTKYRTNDEYDSLSLALSSGPIIKKGRTTYSLPIVFNRLTLEKDDFLKRTVGVAPRISYVLSNKTTLGANVGLSKSYVSGASEYDPKTMSIGFDTTYMWTDTIMLGANANFAKERVAGDFSSYGYDSETYGVSFSKYFSQQLSMHISPSVKYAAYQDETFDLGTSAMAKRDDKTKALNTSFNYYLPEIKGTAVLSFNHSENDSSVAQSSYKRQQMMLLFSKSF